MKFDFSRPIFEKYANIKFHENPFSGNTAVPYGRTDSRTDKMMLIVAFSNFAIVTKYCYIILVLLATTLIS
jgi:hypothetical protein